jgi:hypothetical protein
MPPLECLFFIMPADYWFTTGLYTVPVLLASCFSRRTWVRLPLGSRLVLVFPVLLVMMILSYRGEAIFNRVNLPASVLKLVIISNF